MSFTYKELLKKLMREREIDLLELLEISSEDLVERFEDKISENIDFLMEEYEEELEELYKDMGLDIDE